MVLAIPVLGWDHVIAMVAVGLWGAFLGSLASGSLLLSSRWLWHLVARLV
ncbi:MAG: HupE/UreJ family protein [Thiogranum sp.]